MATFLQQVINGLSLGSVYALIAVGYSLVYSVLLFSNFAHGGFLVIGGYICYGALKSMGVNIWLAGMLSLAGAGIAAALTERIAYKPIRERTNVTLYLLIASMGMSIVIENIFVIVAGGRFRALPPVIPTYPVQLFGLATTSAFDLLSFLIALIALGCLQLFLSRTKWGLAIRAAACDLRTAGLMGVNVNLLISIVFFKPAVFYRWSLGGYWRNISFSSVYSLSPARGHYHQSLCRRSYWRVRVSSRRSRGEPDSWFGGNAGCWFYFEPNEGSSGFLIACHHFAYQALRSFWQANERKDIGVSPCLDILRES